MAKLDRSKVADIIFEGVLIPRGTRSAKIARKGITDVEQMSQFLTAVFSDTLKGKIKLPKSPKNPGISSKMLNGLEQKLRHGVPVKIKGAATPLNGKPKIKTLKLKKIEQIKCLTEPPPAESR